MLDIQKLAAEMGLDCITTYKLDALKSVRRKSESKDMTTECSTEDIMDLNIQNSDSLRSQIETISSAAPEGLDAYPSCGENSKYFLFVFVIHQFFFVSMKQLLGMWQFGNTLL